MIVKFHIKNIFLILKRIKREIKFDVQPKMKLRILERELSASEKIDKISEMHTKLFWIYRNFTGMYQFQMLFSVTSNFSSMMINTLYIYGIYLLKSLDIPVDRGNWLQISSAICIAVRILDAHFQFENTSMVNYMEEKVQRFTSELYLFGRDKRLKESVSKTNKVKD
ncbi:hypothetical protein PVAND_002558 [Polypedilum vanderplanki]|nr:hypothetical protein PVAND_002558 [Polypedilum vanderplanki]